MLISQRHDQIILLLTQNPGITVRDIAKRLCYSEPTIRRDLTELHNKGLVTKCYGGAVVNTGAADREIPFVLRENETSKTKVEIGRQASQFVHDGMVIMLDASTSAYHLVPYLAKFKDIIVITSGAKTAVALAELHIPVYSTGGKMRTNSFAYIGREAEEMVKKFNADALFFSCRGLSYDGQMSDPSIDEANLRQVMFSKCKNKYLLCDSSKFGNSYFYDMGDISHLSDVISDQPLPESIAARLNSRQ